MLSRDIESRLIDYCVNNQISIIAYSILGQGFLSSENIKSKSVNNFPIFGRLSHNSYLNLLKDLSTISSDLGITLSHLAISWVFYNKKISSGICGASNINQLLANIDSAADCIDESTYHSINKILNSYK
jgi:aryl-alcohol dehydrogenase-like predicted oxidoreductase